MRPVQIVVLAVPLTMAAGQFPATRADPLVTAFFHFGDAHPASLEASVVSASEITGPGGVGTTPVAIWLVDCPRSDDACRAASVYPAELTHTRGSVFAGSVTGTRWECKLGGSNGGTGSNSLKGDCVYTVGDAESTTKLDRCGVLARSIVVVATAGTEKLGTMELGITAGVEEIKSPRAEELAEAGCPAGLGAMSVPAKTTGSASGGSAPTKTGSEETGSSTGTTTATVPTGPSATQSGNNAAGRIGHLDCLALGAVGFATVLFATVV